MTKRLLSAEKRSKYGETLFLIGIILELLVMVTDNAAAYTLPYRGRFLQVAFAMFFCKLVLTNYEKLEWIAIIVSLSLGAISYITTDDNYIIRLVMLAIASKGVNVQRIFKIVLIATIVSTMIIVSLSFVGVSGELVDVRHYGRGIEEARYSFGFNHANNVHSTLWYILVIYALCKEFKLNIYEAIVLSIVNVVLYRFTLSRTGVLNVELLLIGVVIVNYCKVKWINKLVYPLTTLVLILCMYLTLISAKYTIYTSKMEAFFDRFLTGRLEMVSEYTDLKNWRLFPGPQSCQYIDDGFAKLFYLYGIAIGTIVIVLMMIEVWHLYQVKNEAACIVLLSVILVFFMEATYIISESLLPNAFVLIYMYMHTKHKKGAMR